MTDFAFELDAGRTCLDFANTHDSAGEHLNAYADLVAFAAQSHFNPDDARWLRAEGLRDPLRADGVMLRARRLRATIYAMFAARAAGQTPREYDVEQLNFELAATLTHARLLPVADTHVRRAGRLDDGGDADSHTRSDEGGDADSHTGREGGDADARTRRGGGDADSHTRSDEGGDADSHTGREGGDADARTRRGGGDADSHTRSDEGGDADSHTGHEGGDADVHTRREGGHTGETEVSYRWGWVGRNLDAPLWGISRSAAELLTNDADLRRVRECGGADCRWLFLDTSKNRTRQWCSMRLCGNREKARRHYARSRTARRIPDYPSS